MRELFLFAIGVTIPFFAEVSYIACYLLVAEYTRTRGTIGSVSPLSIPLAISSQRMEKWESEPLVKKLPHLAICFQTRNWCIRSILYILHNSYSQFFYKFSVVIQSLNYIMVHIKCWNLRNSSQNMFVRKGEFLKEFKPKIWNSSLEYFIYNQNHDLNRFGEQ